MTYIYHQVASTPSRDASSAGVSSAGTTAGPSTPSCSGTVRNTKAFFPIPPPPPGEYPRERTRCSAATLTSADAVPVDAAAGDADVTAPIHSLCDSS